MRPTPLAALMLAAATLSAQTTPSTASPKKPATTAVHRRATAAKVKPAPCPADTAPTLPSGIPPAAGKFQTAVALHYIDITPGTGAEAASGQFLTVQYTGWLASDGTKFDSSLDRSTPFVFPLGFHRVIPGWDDGLLGMKVGGKRRLFIPWQMAYGSTGHPPVIPAKADLIFDVELVSASDQPPNAVGPAAAPHPGAGSSATPQ